MKRYLSFFLFLAATLLTGLNVRADEITPGYYMMKGTSVSTAPGYYLRTTSSNLPHLVLTTMPETLTAQEKCYIWDVQPMKNGAYSIQNLVDSRYLGGQIGSYRHHGSMSQVAHAITFTASASNDGTFKLNADLDMDSGYGTALRPGMNGEKVFLWYCDSQQGEVAAWAFEPVDADVVDRLVQEQLSYNGVDIEEGYYYVRADMKNTSKPGAYLYGNTADLFRMYQTQTEELSTTEINEGMLKYIFYVKKMEGGYSFKNIGIDRYLGGSPNGNGHHVGAVFHATPMVIGNGSEENSYTILDEQQPVNSFLPAYLNSGNEAFAWWAGSAAWLTSSINWNLIKLDTDLVENAVPRTVTAVGSLSGSYWDADDYTYTLAHEGNNVYTGIVSVEDEVDGYGNFSLYCRTAEGATPSIYSPSSAGVELLVGVVENCGIYNEGFTWKVLAGEYLVTFDLKNATVRINDPSNPDYIQSRAYAQLAAAIEKAESEWPDLDLSSVISVLNNEESTDEELEAATNSIPGLIRNYVLNQMTTGASANDPFNATSLITNPSCNGRTGWGGSVLNYSDYNMKAGKNDFDVYQQITGLPNGVYGVAVTAASATGRAVIYTKSSGVKYITHAPVGTAESLETCVAMAYVCDGTITFGASCSNGGAGDDFVCDDWELYYYGNEVDAIGAITENLNETFNSLDDMICSASAKQAFSTAYTALAEISDMADASQLFAALAEANTALDNSYWTYLTYQNAVAEVAASCEQQTGLSGATAERLFGYLNDVIAPSDSYPNGSYLYILANGNIETDIDSEIRFAQQLFIDALRGSSAEGTVFDNLFVNLDFETSGFTGWTEEHEGPGSCSGSHGNGVNNVAGWHNMDRMSMTQTVTGLPDGLYAVSFNGFYRTGTPSASTNEDIVSAYFTVGANRTPVMNIWDGGVSERDAIVGVNCFDGDYSNGEVRIPNSVASVASHFQLGHYAQTVYGTSVDGTLTIGVCLDAFPAYVGDWLMIDNISVRYMGKNEEAAQAMAEAQAERAATLTASSYFFDAAVNEAIYETIGTDATTADELIAKATKLNALCDQYIANADLFAQLEEKLLEFSQTIQTSYDNSRMCEEDYNTYFALYVGSLDAMYSGNISNSEGQELLAQLEKITSELTPQLVDGYYYIKASEVSTASGYYLYASSSDLPHLVDQKAPEQPTVDDKGYIWRVRRLADGNLYIQSITDHRYLGGQVGATRHYGSLVDQPIVITPTYYSAYNGYGSSATDVWKLDAATLYDSNYGTALRPGTGSEKLMLWYCDGQQGDAPAWQFEPVDREVAAALEKTEAPYEGVEIEEGFYYVRSALTNPNKPGAYLYNYLGNVYYTYQEERAEALSTTDVTDSDLAYLYCVTKEKSGYTFLNVDSRRFLAGTMNSNGHLVGTSVRPAPMTILLDEASGNYMIEDKSQRENYYMPAYLNSGNEQCAWWVGAESFKDNCYWNLIPVTGYDDPDGLKHISASDKSAILPADGIYTISGQKVTGKVGGGIYIIVTDGKARKMMLK